MQLHFWVLKLTILGFFTCFWWNFHTERPTPLPHYPLPFRPSSPHFHQRLINDKIAKAEWNSLKGICDLNCLVSTSPCKKLSGMFPTYWSSSDICRTFSRQHKHICTQIPPCKNLHTFRYLCKVMKHRHWVPRNDDEDFQGLMRLNF